MPDTKPTTIEQLQKLRASVEGDEELSSTVNTLVEHSELLSAILDNLSICVSRIDSGGIFTLSRGAGLRRFNLQDDMLVGVDVFQAYQHVKDKIEKAFAGDIIQFTDSGETADQLWFFQNYLIPDRFKGNGIFNIALDITDISLARRELARANEELTQFNYRTSHDLIAPLRTMRGFCSLVREDIEDGNHDEIGEYNRRMEVEIVRLEQLVRDILRLSRADHVDDDIEDIDFADVVRCAKEGLGFALEDNRVRIETAFTHERPLHSSRTRVSQIVENLLANGIRFANIDRESSFVKISTANLPENDFEITISDNGIGIPRDSQDKVFSMFFQAHSDRSEGSGLGLYLIKKHIHHMNGFISLESSEQGSTFRIVLPNQHGAVDGRHGHDQVKFRPRH